MKLVFTVNGRVTIDTDAGTITLGGVDLPPAVVPPPAGTLPPVVEGDQIDLAQAQLSRESPDVRGWPIGARLTEVGLSFGAVMSLNFTKRNGPDAWPIVMGAEGEIQYTLWIGCRIDGQWHIAGSILCISRGPNDNYVPTGPTLTPGQVPDNWYYFAGRPLATYQPQPGELVAWFLTAGVQRRTDIHIVAERTQVVLTPFSPGLFTF